MSFPSRFRKRPVVVTAQQYVSGCLIDGVTEGPDGPVCQTLEGPLHVSDGDWIITGVNGERYPCKPDVFAKSYEPVND